MIPNMNPYPNVGRIECNSCISHIHTTSNSVPMLQKEKYVQLHLINLNVVALISNTIGNRCPHARINSCLFSAAIRQKQNNKR